MLTTTIFWT